MFCDRSFSILSLLCLFKIQDSTENVQQSPHSGGSLNCCYDGIGVGFIYQTANTSERALSVGLVQGWIVGGRLYWRHSSFRKTHFPITSMGAASVGSTEVQTKSLGDHFLMMAQWHGRDGAFLELKRKGAGS
jgi:hypothetical protein